MNQLALSLVILLIGLVFGLVGRRPFADIYFPLLWYGHIFVIDCLVFYRTGSSLWRNHRKIFFTSIPISAGCWWVFEGFNHFVKNWHYAGGELYTSLEFAILTSVSFSTVILAVFEMTMLVKSFSLFKNRRAWPKVSFPLNLKRGMIILGLISIFLPIGFPRLFFPLVWLGLFFLLDPINNLRSKPSTLGFLERGDWVVPISIYLGTTITGIFWEFYNFWVFPHWYYTLPYLDFWHIFQMPFLGYFGYGPFGLELFSMWNFFLAFLLPFWLKEKDKNKFWAFG